jgi:NAD(P)H-hydrate epimerase
MKALTAAQMRDVDRRTIELGIPGIVLMENAGNRVVDLLVEKFSPLARQRIAVLCGKGNNGGDGLVVARQLFTRFQPQALHVVLFASPEQLRAEAAQNFAMLTAAGCTVADAIPAQARNATIVIDALLGTGAGGAATGAALQGIREINTGFPLAKVIAVDIPSGLPSDTPEPAGEYARADYTVTFTAPKIAHVLPPTCDAMGELHVAAIGSPARLWEEDPAVFLSLLGPERFRHLLAPRPSEGHKGTFGHVLVVGGAAGKAGAAVMSGLGALRAGAGLVTVASSEPASRWAPELMTAPLDLSAAEGKDVIAIGPGLGTAPESRSLVAQALAREVPLVIDADALKALPPQPLGPHIRVLTPHPGEMAHLTGVATAQVLADRLRVARSFAIERSACVVLKGHRSLIAFPDGQVWVNPTGTPALATGGTGDILTGLIAGFLAQFRDHPAAAVLGAVYLHGLAGRLGAAELGEKCLIATDVLRYLPAAMEECARVHDRR